MKFFKKLFKKKQPVQFQGKLTAKQEVFAQEYVKTLNGTKSAMKAKYSPKAAAEIASENLRKPKIRERIDELMAKEGLSGGDVVKEHAKIVKQDKDLKTKHSGIRTYYELTGHLGGKSTTGVTFNAPVQMKYDGLTEPDNDPQ